MRRGRHPYGFRFTGHESFFEDDWEACERSIVREQLATADVFIDVGACHGIYSCLAASMGLRVAAIEPDSANLQILMSNIRANGFDTVEVFPVALSGAAGVRELFGAHDIASLTPGWFGAGGDSARYVPTNTLDNLFASRWRDERVFVKVDAEGEEYGVLQGATAFMERGNKPGWLIETFPFRQDRYPERNPDFARLFALMSGHGYRCRHAETGEAVTADLADRWAARPEEADIGSSNFFFYPDGRTRSRPPARRPG